MPSPTVREVLSPYRAAGYLIFCRNGALEFVKGDPSAHPFRRSRRRHRTQPTLPPAASTSVAH